MQAVVMGVDAQGFPEGTPEARSRLCVCQASFLMTFAMGRVPHAGPQHISVYKNGPWKIKNGINSWKDWSPHVVLSLTFWLKSHLECGGSSSLLILPGLLRSDWGGLSVSSPSGELEDACGLRR